MRALIGFLALAAMLATPAHAQVDPTNPEHVFRAYAALSGGGARCKVADAIDENVAQQFGDQMMGPNNPEARKVYNEIYNFARTGDCAAPNMPELMQLAAKNVQSAADGIVLAYLDQGFCPPAPAVSTMRLFAVYRQGAMTEERKKAAEASRATWRDALKTECAKASFNEMGDVTSNTNAVVVRHYFSTRNGSCISDWAKTVGPFDCVYGKRPAGPEGYDDLTKFSRQSIRAALAKALALEADKTGACGQFTAAERAVGKAQMEADARFGLAKYNATSKQPAKKDPDKGYKTVAEVAAAGAALAKTATCDDLTKDIPVLADDTPDTLKGEQILAASGAARIRETMDRVAMLAAAMPSCKALPSFAATKTAAEAYVTTMTPERRLLAAAEADRFIFALDAAECDATKLGKPFAQTALFVVDALNGAWK